MLHLLQCTICVILLHAVVLEDVTARHSGDRRGGGGGVGGHLPQPRMHSDIYFFNFFLDPVTCVYCERVFACWQRNVHSAIQQQPHVKKLCNNTMII